MKKNIIFFLTLSVLSLAFLSNSSLVNAVATPDFSNCTNPQGTILASYDSGTHGVPGDGTTYTGKDTVYSISNETVLQCLCPEGKAGIQTKWWRYGQLTNDEISILVRDGWIYIPNGSLWGLSEGPYLAKNSNYSCNGNGEKGGGSSNSSSNGTGGGGDVSGTTSTTGSVLGISSLAATGNSSSILLLIIVGALFIFLSRKFRSVSK